MRIGFVLNDVMNEALPSTTLNLAKRAQEMGHEIWLTGVGDFVYDASDRLLAHARAPLPKKYKTTGDFLAAMTSKDARAERIGVEDLDILFLRNDPAADYDKPWAQQAGVVFGYAAVKHGVIVLNDPVTLSKAINKMYFQYFPREVRLGTLIARNEEDIVDFYYAHGQKIIIKPLMGSGGRNVFLVQPEDEPNIRQMIASVMRDGYVIAQEYYAPASKGDIRFFMINGEPFRVATALRSGQTGRQRQRCAQQYSRRRACGGGGDHRRDPGAGGDRPAETGQRRDLLRGARYRGEQTAGDQYLLSGRAWDREQAAAQRLYHGDGRAAGEEGRLQTLLHRSSEQYRDEYSLRERVICTAV